MNADRTQPDRGHCSMASAVTDCRGSRPDNLLRPFPDQERANLWSPCSDCSSDENNSPTALNSFNWDKPALEDKTVDFGWPGTRDKERGKSFHSQTTVGDKKSEQTGSGYVNVRTADVSNKLDCTSSELKHPSKKERKECGPVPENLYPKLDRLGDSSKTLQESSSNDQDTELEENDSRSEEEIAKEREDLRNVAWFQEGIPREIALEVLSEKPEGSFIVRQSTTKPGCYALSLRVPTTKNPSGIAHYLILNTNKGYKIKGFTKEFSTLNALITHHSVMPELLPCPLDLSRPSVRDAEREFAETEHKKCDIFSDIHWLMTDLEV